VQLLGKQLYQESFIGKRMFLAPLCWSSTMLILYAMT